MSFLVPLYFAGLLAISLPIAFHLIRRTPRGQRLFSSFLFLRASPPRLTRRSRIEHWLLLCLRALALLLIALAFTRPFLRETLSTEVAAVASRRIAILLDTSASMQRSGLWQAALNEVDAVIAEAEDVDLLALYAFDESLEVVVSFDDFADHTPSARREELSRLSRSLAPSHRSTQLGPCLAIAADRVSDSRQEAQVSQVGQIVLISDLQAGSKLQSLASYDWPDAVTLEVHSLAPEAAGNAGMQWVRSRDDAFDDVASADLPEGERSERVLVMNAASSTAGTFDLQWANEGGVLDDALEVQVPPGQSRVIRALARPVGATQLRLTGDESAFDNVLFIGERQKEKVAVHWVEEASEGDQQSLGFYLQRVFHDDSRRSVTVLRDFPERQEDRPLVFDVPLIVAEDMPKARAWPHWATYLNEGGTVLLVLSAASFEPTESPTESLLQMLMVEPDETSEAAIQGRYAMLSDLRLRHPLFAPFRDAPFSDFTGIHFWRYRQLLLPTDSDVEILASFDSGAPYLLERRVGAGRVLAMTSGWQPSDSELARSSKFPAFMNHLLDRTRRTDELQIAYVVGDAIPVPALQSEPPQVAFPDGSLSRLAETDSVWRGAQEPGVYEFIWPGKSVSFAVNLAADESRTEPLDISELEKHGVAMKSRQTPLSPEQMRQMHDVELESRQKLWRWLLMAAIVVLLVETWLSGRPCGKPEQKWKEPRDGSTSTAQTRRS